MQAVDRERLRGLVAAGAQLVEVLPAEEYAREHLPGAVNLPLQHLEAQALSTLDRARPIVVYCADLY